MKKGKLSKYKIPIRNLPGGGGGGLSTPGNFNFIIQFLIFSSIYYYMGRGGPENKENVSLKKGGGDYYMPESNFMYLASMYGSEFFCYYNVYLVLF